MKSRIIYVGLGAFVGGGLLALSLLTVSSCTTNDYPKIERKKIGAGAQAGKTYATYFQAWFGEHCVSCHGAAGTPPALDTLDAIKAAGAGVVRSVGTRRMPPSNSTVTKEQYLDLKAWAEAGYPAAPAGGGAGGAGGGDPWGTGPGDGGGAGGGAAWETTQIASLLKDSCLGVGCHDTGGVPPDLSTYATASADAERVKARVVAKTMPTPQRPPLTDDEIALVQAWVDAGAPESDPPGAGGTPDPVTPPGGTPPGGTPPGGADAVTYDLTVRTILQNSCDGAGCHVSGPVQPAMGNAAEAKAAAAAIVNSVEAGRMPIPTSKIDDAGKQALREWLDSGAN